MGKRGPTPKPTALRVLHGDRKDRINDAEPIPAEGEIAAPEELSDEARAVWDRLAPDLIRLGVLTTWDVDAFAITCEALARYRAATRLVNGSALLVQGPNGLIKNPALMVQREAEVTFAQYGARFGLTPSDRSQLKVDTSGAGSGRAPSASSRSRPPRTPRLPECGFTLDGRTCRQRGDHFCRPRAAHAVALCQELCRHTKDKWARRPFLLARWQRRDIIEPLFGTVAWDPEWESYVRRYQTDAGKHLGLRVLSIYGGRPYEPQIAALRKGVDIVVGTPGRLLDLADRLA